MQVDKKDLYFWKENEKIYLLVKIFFQKWMAMEFLFSLIVLYREICFLSSYFYEKQ